MSQDSEAKSTCLDKIRKILQSHTTCVMATISPENEPHTSLMTYISDDDATHIHMITSPHTKKWKNLVHNQNISLLIDTRESDTDPIKALTVKGKMIIEPQRDEILKRLNEKHPFLKGITSKDDAEIISVKVHSFQLLEGIHDLSYVLVE